MKNNNTTSNNMKNNNTTSDNMKSNNTTSDNFKEDDRALPVWELLLFCCRSDTRAPSFWRSEWPETWPGWRLSWMPCISDTVYDIGLSSRQSR